jgi:hypothetical protein
LEITKQELVNIVQVVVDATVKRLVDTGVIGANASLESASASSSASSKKRGKRASASASSERTAYQQTEALLFSYNNFKKIVADKRAEIEEIRTYGVPQCGSAVVQYSKDGKTPKGLVLDEERIEEAVKKIEKSMEMTVLTLDLIDKSMAAISTDPYFKALEMRYFEGRTQEDIAVAFKCTQQNISYNKSRLIKELSIKMFPDKVAREYLG